MPYFHACTYGIYARDNSNVRLNQPNRFTSITGAAVSIDTHSILVADGVSGSTGSSLEVKNANIGVFGRSAKIFLGNARFKDCSFGTLVKESTYFNISNSTYDFYGSPTANAAGVVMDMGCIGSVYGISITGYVSATGSLTGATFKVVNQSTLFVDATGTAALANTTPYGTVLVDTSRGTNAGGLVPTNTNQIPPTIES